MASFEVDGKLHVKYDTLQRTETFRLRKFVIEIAEGMYPQFCEFQLKNDKCEIIDQFVVGDMIRVSFNLEGRAWQKNPQETVYLTNLGAWRISRPEAGATQGAASPSTPVQQATPPVYNANTAAPAADNNDTDGDNLPF